jgi:hypothetical protein
MGQSLTKALEKNQALNYSDQSPQHSIEILCVDSFTTSVGASFIVMFYIWCVTCLINNLSAVKTLSKQTI